MDASVDTGIFAEALHLSAVREADRMLDLFERGLRRFGASHVLLTGLPLPRRSVTKLILRIVWPDLRSGGHVIDVPANDPLLALSLAARRPLVVRGGQIEVLPPIGTAASLAKGAIASELLAAAGGSRVDLLVVPVHDLRPYQGCVVIAGEGLPTGPSALAGLEHYCLTALRRLVDVGRLDLARPGDLSERERHVLQLTAIGKTAAEIADLLEISQRTVHAHLQNASDKMNASNKTHTVVEALRYGQIAL
jgi:DNA-binding CsgD family transcriptional regulator